MEAIYDIEVTTGSMTHAGTFDNIFITLIGTQGVSERTKLDSYGRDFKTGMVRFSNIQMCGGKFWLKLVISFFNCWIF